MNYSKATDSIVVTIVEDEREVREGLRYLIGLDSRISIAGAFESGEEFLQFLQGGGKTDVVLMDIHLPGMDGITLTQKVSTTYGEIIILILTIFEDSKRILDAILAGARGYILKNTKPEQLLDQIISAVEGGSPISPAIARQILERVRETTSDTQPHDYQLTTRELEVLKDIVNGLTYKELADKHHIAGSTAKKHILHIYQKLNVNSKAEVVKKALEEHLI